MRAIKSGIFLQQAACLLFGDWNFSAAETANQRTFDFKDAYSVFAQNAVIGFKTVFLSIEIKKLMEVFLDKIVW